MNLFKASIFFSMLTYVWLPTAHADEELSSLPTITVMAESEMRDEIGSVPFQEDKDMRKALQHKIIRSENDIQNFVVSENVGVIDIQPKTTSGDISQMNPFAQSYVLAVAKGLQSSDPTSGLFKMLEPLGVDRNAALEGVRNGTVKFNLDSNMLKLLEGNMFKP